MADLIFNGAKERFALGDLHWDTDDIRALLIKTAAATDPDDEFVADLLGGAAVELTDGSYARVTVDNRSVVKDDTDDHAELTGDPIEFPTLAGAEDVLALVIYLHVTNDADSPLIGAFDSSFTTSGATETFTPHADGYIRLV